MQAMLRDVRNLLNSLRFAFGKPSEYAPYPPAALWIEVTNKCNLRCVMCANSLVEKSKTGFMEWEVFRRIVDEASGYATTAFLFLGGEPLLHRDIFRMIAYAESRGMKVRLHTNATLLDEAKAEKLIASGLSLISFSFDGYDKESYEKVRVGAKFERTLENVRNFLKIKGSSKKPYTILQNIVEYGEDEETKRRREAFYRMFSDLPLDDIEVRMIHPWAGKFSDSEFRLPPVRKDRFYPCAYLWRTMNILWNGTVVPCCLDITGEVTLGNVREKSLREIWNDLPIRRMRRLMLERRHEEIEMCRNCQVLRDSFMGISGVLTKIMLYSAENMLGFRSTRAITRGIKRLRSLVS